ncbi:MAG: CotH kinase family protein [bacterium]
MKSFTIRKYVTFAAALAVFYLSAGYAGGAQQAVITESTAIDEIVSDTAAPAKSSLYDETVLRTISLDFAQQDWWQQMINNHNAGGDANVLADLTMDGVTYHGVGVRFKGMTSYMMAGNSQKKSFNIEIDETDPDQRLMGYKTLNLNNAALDPSFIREVLYFDIARKYIPCPKANFVKLIINGENWGIYVNAQQNNSDLIEEWFQSSDGDRWKVGGGMGGGQGGVFTAAQQPSFSDWLDSPEAQDANGDGLITEEDYTILMRSQRFPSNRFPQQMSFEEWAASPMAMDMNGDGQITEDDYTILMDFWTNLQGQPGVMPIGDPNMVPGAGGMVGGMVPGGMVPGSTVPGVPGGMPWAMPVGDPNMVPAAGGTIGFFGGMIPGGTVLGSTIPGGMVPGGMPWAMPVGDPNMVPAAGGTIGFFGGMIPGGTAPGGTVPGGTVPGGMVPGGTPWAMPAGDPNMVPAAGGTGGAVAWGAWGTAGWGTGGFGGAFVDANMIDAGGRFGGGIGGGNIMMFGGSDGALSWLGTDTTAYERAYELKTAKTDDPWGHLITTCNILNNTPLEQLPGVVDTVLAVDRWLWFLAVENIFTDEDGYLTKGWDYQIYYEVETGRIHPLEHDGNETFDARFINLSPVEGTNSASRPVISRLLAVPQFRQRYLAHVRTILDEWFNWNALAPKIEAYKALIADEVRADTKKLYSNDQFEASFTDIEDFINNRRDYLLNYAEINRQVPHIYSVVRTITPEAGESPFSWQSVEITADVEGAGGSLEVILHYAQGVAGPFVQVSMFDDGAHGDGEAGDGIFGGIIPPFPAGSLVRYYVEARASQGSIVQGAPAAQGAPATDTAQSSTFAPSGAEDRVFAYRVFIATDEYTPVVINEVMAKNEATIQDPQGEYEDWIELLNVGDQRIDLSGMYLSDTEDTPRKWKIPQGTTLDPGAYLIIWADEDDNDTPGLHANFKLSTDGESVMLVNTDELGNDLIDLVAFGKQEANVSYGRNPNGTGPFQILPWPTPNGDNLLSHYPGNGSVGENPGSGTVSGGEAPSANEAPSAIELISPLQAKQGDMGVVVTITLNQRMITMFPSDTLPSSVKIGTLTGKDTSRNGLEITSIFDIPGNEPPGMKDVSIEFPAPQISGTGGFQQPIGGQMPGGIQPPAGFQFPTDMQPPTGFQPPGGTQLPTGFQPPGGIQPPAGFQPPSGAQPPAGFQFPDGAQASVAGGTMQGGQGITFTKSAAFEILAGDTAGLQPPVGSTSLLFINEFMADNDNTIEDPDEPGSFEDWIEIYNPADSPVLMAGMYLTDDLNNPTKWQIPEGVSIPARGYLIFWADEDQKQGNTHTNFKLGKGGEAIGLFDTEAKGNVAIDTVVFEQQTTNISQGRMYDGGESWVFFENATPGSSNFVSQTGPDVNNPPVQPNNGDLNGDGNITPADSLAAFQCYLGLATCSDNADVNMDGSVTPSDALCIFKKYLTQPSCLD